MAKRYILPVTKHKPLRSSWYSIIMQPNRNNDDDDVIPVYNTAMGKALINAQRKKLLTGSK